MSRKQPPTKRGGETAERPHDDSGDEAIHAAKVKLDAVLDELQSLGVGCLFFLYERDPFTETATVSPAYRGVDGYARMGILYQALKDESETWA